MIVTELIRDYGQAKTAEVNAWNAMRNDPLDDDLREEWSRQMYELDVIKLALKSQGFDLNRQIWSDLSKYDKEEYFDVKIRARTELREKRNVLQKEEV
jgi:hypothetical protein